jgi:hypothetical protein
LLSAPAFNCWLYASGIGRIGQLRWFRGATAVAATPSSSHLPVILIRLAGAGTSLAPAWRSGRLVPAAPDRFVGWRLNYVRQRLGAGELWTVSAPTYGILRSPRPSLRSRAPSVIDAADCDQDGAAAVAAVGLRRFRVSPPATRPSPSPPVILLRQTGLEPQLRADYLGQTVVSVNDGTSAEAFRPRGATVVVASAVPVVEDPWLLLVLSTSPR